MSSIRAKNVNHDGYSEPLNAEKYEHIRDAILTVLAVDSEGITFSELEGRVADWLREHEIPSTLFTKPGSVRWYVKAVELDLEARELIERVPGVRPLRLRKRAQPA